METCEHDWHSMTFWADYLKREFTQVVLQEIFWCNRCGGLRWGYNTMFPAAAALEPTPVAADRALVEAGRDLAESMLDWAENFEAAWVWQERDGDALANDPGWQTLKELATRLSTLTQPSPAKGAE